MKQNGDVIDEESKSINKREVHFNLEFKDCLRKSDSSLSIGSDSAPEISVGEMSARSNYQLF